jgi:hypothetical protein
VGMEPGLVATALGLAAMEPGLVATGLGLAGMEPGLVATVPGLAVMEPGPAGMALGPADMEPGLAGTAPGPDPSLIRYSLNDLYNGEAISGTGQTVWLPAGPGSTSTNNSTKQQTIPEKLRGVLLKDGTRPGVFKPSY